MQNVRRLCLAITLFCLSVAPAWATLADHLVISEIQIDSVAGSGGTADDWVELYNPTNTVISLNDYSIQKMNASGGSFYRKNLTGEIPAYGFFLIVRNHTDTSAELKDAADVLAAGSSFSLSENNTIFLVAGDDDIEDANDPDIIDFVGFGSAENFETTAAENPDETGSLERKSDSEHSASQGNGWDTDDNAADFFLQTEPNPQSSTSEIEQLDIGEEPEPEPENTAPNVPTEFSPTGFSNSKLFSAYYSDPEEDMGLVEWSIFSAEPADCAVDENLVVSSSSELLGNKATAEVVFDELADGEYFYCARASDEELYSDWSEVQSFTLDTVVPTFTEGFELSAVAGDSEVSLTWLAAEGDVVSYVLNVNDEAQIDLGDLTSFVQTGLNNDQEYSFTLTAIDAAGNESAALSATAMPTAPQLFTTAESGDVVINEVAWMGTETSANDEWIELKNTSATKMFDLTGWKLVAEDGSPEITLTGTLDTGAYFLLERTDDDSASDVPADQIYSGGLSNSGEVLILYDSAETEIDRIDGSADWSVGGDNDSKQTLVRTSDGSYRTSFEVGGSAGVANFYTHDVAVASITSDTASPLPNAVVMFAAGLENRGESAETFTLEWLVDDAVVSIVSDISLASFESSTQSFEWTSTEGDHAVSARVTLTGDEDTENDAATLNLSVANHLVINEFVANPEGSDAEHEWIELFNPTDVAVDLTGFQLNGLSLSGEVAAQEYVVFSASEFLGTWDALPNTSGEVILQNAVDEIIDSKSYSSVTEKKSWGRSSTDLNTWTEFWHPTRGSENIETNTVPEARITIQGSGNTTGGCSLYVNLSGEDSVDADGDELSYEWDFGDGSTSEDDNPSGFYFSYGDYTVTLTVTDVLGEGSESVQSFSVSACSNSGGDDLKKEIVEPVIESISVDEVELLITEVAFNSKPDWLRVLMVDDHNNGDGVDIGGLYFEDDKNFKTIPEGTILKTGETLLLTFGGVENIQDSEDAVQLTTDRKGLTKTDEQVMLKDSSGKIEDAVVWENQNGKWSRGEEKDVQAVVDVGAWYSIHADQAVDSSLIGRDFVLKRMSDEAGNLLDTNTAQDWEILTPVVEEVTKSEVPTTPDAQIVISEILANPIGSDKEEWFELKNVGETRAELFGWSIATEKKTYYFTESMILGPGELKTFTGLLTLRNSGDALTLFNPEETIIDTVDYPTAREGVAYARNAQGIFTETEIPTPNVENRFFQILDTAEDSDFDGLSDEQEMELGTDPAQFDSDNDGLPDAFEINHGLNPKIQNTSETELNAYREELKLLASSRFDCQADEEEGVKLAGRGVPSGTMRIYIQSDLKVVEVPVDETGSWSYVLDQELEAGEHHIFTQLISPNGVIGVAEKVMHFVFQQDYVPPQYSTDIRISELLPNPEGSDEAEWIELENFSAELADVSGFKLHSGSSFFVFPENSMIEPHNFLLVPRSDSGITLLNLNGEVVLQNPHGKIISQLTYKKTQENVALAWDGGGFATTTKLTPSEGNIISAPLKKPSKKSKSYYNGNLSSAILISEVLANPAGKESGEWIELWNRGDSVLNLGNWKLDDAEGGSKAYVIPDTVFLRPNEFRIFPRTLTKLQLNNSEEAVRLFNWQGTMIDSVVLHNSREGSTLAREGNGDFRETKIFTPAAVNQFDTTRLSGKIEFRGEDGFVVQSAEGEKFVYFGVGGISLLARALLQDGVEYEVFVREEGDEIILDDFKIAPNFLQADVLAADVSVSRVEKNSSWMFALFVFVSVFVLLRRFEFGSGAPLSGDT